MQKLLTFLKKNIGYIIFALLTAAIIALGIKYRVAIADIIKSQAARDEFVAWVKSKGAFGLLIFMMLQILQVVIAIIPGEPIELMAGALYGTWGGLLVCEAGLLIGSIGVYSFVKMAGAKSVPEEALKKYKFLRDEEHVKFALFMLYFIPGTPKDILLYVGPFMPVGAKTFFLLSTIARIPSIITSTYTGAHLMQGDVKASIITAAITGAIALICIINQENILHLIKKINEKRAEYRERHKDKL